MRSRIWSAISFALLNPTVYSIGVALCILNVVQTVRIESDEVRIIYATETALWSKCFFFFEILG